MPGIVLSGGNVAVPSCSGSVVLGSASEGTQRINTSESDVRAIKRNKAQQKDRHLELGSAG